MDRIQFGAFYSRGCGIGPGEFAKKAEDLGFDGFFASETPTNRGPSDDTFTTLAYAAAATTRITVAPDVLLLPLHHPHWVAKQFGTLDRFSNGRAFLAVGAAGEYAKQFEALGMPVSERGKRTNEGIDIIRKFWTEDEVSYHGDIFNFDGIQMEPRPPARPGRPHPPIWVGGRPGGTEVGPDGNLRKKSATGAIKRAAERGDGWDPYYMTPDMYRDSVEQIRDHAASIGRDLTNYEWALTTFWLMRPSYDEALEAAKKKLRYGRDMSERIEKYDILGNPDDIEKRLQSFIDAGVRYFICNWSCEPDEVLQHIEWIAKEVMPRFK